MKASAKKIAVLSGGVGGAKLVDGLYRSIPAENLSIIVNTGDDFSHWGLWICPDLDTILYTLGGIAHPTQGWGITNDTFQVLSAMKARGAADWFRIGDYDLATDLIRNEMLNEHRSLTEVTRHLADMLSIRCRVLPMCNSPRPTFVECDDDRILPFQRWLVQEGAVPKVRRMQYRGDGLATPEVLQAIRDADFVFIGPSNPYTSIDPILATPQIRDALRDKIVIGVSPLIQKQSVKGPLPMMIRSIANSEPNTGFIIQHYSPLVRGFLIHHGDSADLPVRQKESDILMRQIDDRIAVAYELLAFAESFS